MLHLEPGESSATLDHLRQALSLAPEPTLIVIDYLEQMAGLDLGALRRLRPAWAHSGSPVALLANARPGVLDGRNPEWDSLFEQLRLEQEQGQQEQIALLARERLAPEASHLLGTDRVRALCGERPIIALLIAEELERRARRRTLTDQSLEGIRGGELRGWLRRRLSEDFPKTSAGGGLRPPPIEALEVAATAILACAPQRRVGLARAGEAALAVLGEEEVRGHELVEMLDQIGWIEPDGESLDLRTPHDVVADEMIEVQFAECRSGRRQILVDGTLAPGQTDPRSLGRLADSLRRTLVSTTSQDLGTKLADEAVRWWRSSTGALASTLSDAETIDAAAYAMGAVLDGPPWTDVAVETWSEVFGDWLRRHGSELEARHLLYRGLRRLAEGQAGNLIDVAIVWCELHGATENATFVLAPLLGRTDLAGEHAKDAIGQARRWLTLHGDALEAQFVLYPLLKRSDLADEHARDAIGRARHWLTLHGDPLEARFVLHSLLGRTDLPDEHVEDAIGRARRWLTLHGDPLEAGFVLHPLLKRSDLADEHARDAIGRARHWLTLHGDPLEARFVLHSLLGRTDLAGEHAKDAIGQARHWLALHGDALEAEFVLSPLVGRIDLASEHARDAIGRARHWLTLHGDPLEARFVLHSLLGRTDLPDEHAKDAIGRARHWLTLHEDAPEAGFVLRPLLGRTDLPDEHAEDAIGRARRWLTLHGEALEAQFVLHPLLGRTDLAGEHAKDAIGQARHWLTLHGDALEAGFVLNPLLGRDDLSDLAARGCVLAALRWLRRHGNSGDAGFVLRPLLTRDEYPRSIGEALERLAVRWVRANRNRPDVDFLAGRLLKRRSLSEVRWLQTAEVVLDWCRRSPVGPPLGYQLARIIGGMGLLTRSERRAWATEVRRWEAAGAPGPGWLISQLLTIAAFIEVGEPPEVA